MFSTIYHERFDVIHNKMMIIIFSIYIKPNSTEKWTNDMNRKYKWVPLKT